VLPKAKNVVVYKYTSRGVSLSENTIRWVSLRWRSNISQTHWSNCVVAMWEFPILRTWLIIHHALRVRASRTRVFYVVNLLDILDYVWICCIKGKRIMRL